MTTGGINASSIGEAIRPARTRALPGAPASWHSVLFEDRPSSHYRKAAETISGLDYGPNVLGWFLLSRVYQTHARLGALAA